jgi:hypothetical protein
MGTSLMFLVVLASGGRVGNNTSWQGQRASRCGSEEVRGRQRLGALSTLETLALHDFMGIVAAEWTKRS